MKNILRKFYVLILAIIMLMAVLMYSQYTQTKQTFKDEILKNTQSNIEVMQHELFEWFEDKRLLVANMADYSTYSDWTDEAALSYFEKVLEENPEITSLYFGTPDNHMINGSGWIPPEGFDLRTRPWYQEAMASDEVVLTDVFENASGDDQIITVSKKVTRDDGEIIGVISADISSQTVQSIIKWHDQQSIDDVVIVNASKAIQFMAGDSDGEGITILADYLQQYELSDTPQCSSLDSKSVFQMVSQRPIEGTPWHIVAYIELSEESFLSSNLNRGFLAIAIFALIVIVSNALLINTSIIKPIIEIEKGIEQINPEKDASYRLSMNIKHDFDNLIDKINDLLGRIENYIFMIRQDRIKLNHMNAQLKKTLAISEETEQELNWEKKNLEALFKNSTDAIVQFDDQNRIVDINEVFTEVFGYELYEVELKELDTIVAKGLPDVRAEQYSEAVFKGEAIRIEGQRVAKDGSLIDVSINGIPISNESAVIGGFAIYTDIRGKKCVEREIDRQKAMFENLFKNSSDAIVVFDNDQQIIDINESFSYLFGYSSEEVIGEYIDDVIADDSERQKAIALTESLLAGRKAIHEGVRTGKNASKREVLVKGVPIFYGGQVIGGYGIYSDISARKRAEREILHISYHDQLTGLYNRRFFEEELKRLDTKRNLPLALIMADVNGLKLFNDAFGHKMGDQLLKNTAGIFRKICRDDEIIARLGGDEFVILLPGTTLQETEGIVNRIKEESRQTKVGNLELSISFGWDVKYDVEDPMEELYKRVEDYMYRNKLVESPSVHGKMFDTIIKTLHEKNPREEQHSSRVSELSAKFAKALGMDSREIEELKTAGWLHDIGKVAISESILNKKGKLDHEEWMQIKRHPEIGYRILSTVNEMADLAEIVLVHHERWDGKGYPRGLKGEEIPLQGRIIAVADAFDAMTRQRTYREVLSCEEAIVEIRKNAGLQFDPEITEIFIEKVILESEL